jgi:drug/metabolite transporter (DMT)-like permease
MNTVIFIGFGLFSAASVILWIYAFRDLSRNTTFNEESKTVWFCIILFGPVGGSIAYLSAKRNVEKYSSPDATRLSRLLNGDKDA